MDNKVTLITLGNMKHPVLDRKKTDKNMERKLSRPWKFSNLL